jgi:hypothetical protein
VGRTHRSWDVDRCGVHATSSSCHAGAHRLPGRSGSRHGLGPRRRHRYAIADQAGAASDAGEPQLRSCLGSAPRRQRRDHRQPARRRGATRPLPAVASGRPAANHDAALASINGGRMDNFAFPNFERPDLPRSQRPRILAAPPRATPRTIGTRLEDTCSATTSSPRSPVPPTRTTSSSWPGIPAVCSTTRRTRGPFRSQAVGGGRAGDGMLLKTPSSSAAARTGPPPPGPSSATRQAMPSSTQERTPVGPSSSGRSERGRSDSDPRSGHSLDHSSRSLPLSPPMSRSGRSDMVPPALRRRPKLAREKWPSLMGDHGDHRP